MVAIENKNTPTKATNKKQREAQTQNFKVSDFRFQKK